MGSELSLLDLLSGRHKLIESPQKAIEINNHALAEIRSHIALLGCFEQVGLQDGSDHYCKLTLDFPEGAYVPRDPRRLSRWRSYLQIEACPLSPAHEVTLKINAAVVGDAVSGAHARPFEDDVFPAVGVVFRKLAWLGNQIPDVGRRRPDGPGHTDRFAQFQTPLGEVGQKLLFFYFVHDHFRLFIRDVKND
jgi:hypothetical protein